MAFSSAASQLITPYKASAAPPQIHQVTVQPCPPAQPAYHSKSQQCG